MNALAPLVAAVALAQGEPQAAREPPAAPDAEAATTAVSPPPPRRKPPQPDALPRPVPAEREKTSAAPTPAPPGAREKRSSTPAPPSPGARDKTSSTPAAPVPGAREKSAAADRDDAERAARAFLEALAAGDADGLVRASSERFSFDGEPQSGRDAIRGAWRAILSTRDGPRPQVGRLEILAAAEAVSRLGPPPARIAPLARPGVLVAVADVGGRPVVLFLAREAGRMAVLGMHD